MLVNLYKSVKNNTPQSAIEIFDVYDYIRSDDSLKSATENIQERFKTELVEGFAEGAKKAYQEAKTDALPCVIFSGCFDRSVSADEQSGVTHSGRINIDIDMNSAAELDAFFNAICDGMIPFIEAAARSVSGIFNGALWANVLVEMPQTFSGVLPALAKALRLTETNFKSRLHTSYFEMFSDMLLADAGIKTGAAKDIKRVRYLSHDSEIYVNPQAVQVTQQLLLNHTNSKQKQTRAVNKEMNEQFSGMSDPFRIATKYAENRAGACVPGNQHNFVVYLATCLNRMGITEAECTEYVTGKMGLTIGSNCISFPYRTYSADFGVWHDWKEKAPKEAPTETNVPKPEAKPETPSHYFMPLGFNKDETGVQRFYFYAFMPNSIIALTAAKMTEKNLFTLAPMNYWEIAYPKKTGFDINSAVNNLIEMCNERGYFSPLKIRGRGAWMDNGKVVIHTGNELIIEGRKHKLGTVETEYIYEIGAKIDISMDNPMGKEEASKHAEILGKLNWSRGEFDAMLLTGWLALVPIAGVLKWRPHIWITGGAGSGKTWVNKDVINRLTGDFAYKLEGGSTVSGIRQLIGSDAMSIVFDEAEGENDREKARIEDILHLVRSSSSSDSMIVKFNQMTVPRSMFAFFSIVPQTVHNADKRRVTILRLGKGREIETFKRIEKQYRELVSGDFVKRFQARMITLMPQILQSIDTMVAAIARKTGKRDLADQIGSMLAGWWHSTEDAAMTDAQADAIIEELDFSNEQAMEVMPEEQRCLQHILSAQMRVNDFQLNVGELLEIVHNCITSADVSYSVADQALKRNGIKLDGNFLYIATSDSILFIRQMMRGTNWATDHRYVLERIEGASYKSQVYFCNGLKPPAVAVPIAWIFGEK